MPLAVCAARQSARDGTSTYPPAAQRVLAAPSTYGDSQLTLCVVVVEFDGRVTCCTTAQPLELVQYSTETLRAE